jgi:predicted NBD/HSP70 family sugar kinase
MEEKILSFDVTLTGAMIGVVDETGNLIFGEKVQADYVNLDRSQIIASLKENALRLLEKYNLTLDEITRVAADVSGFIDHSMGIVKWIPLLSNFTEWNLKADLAKAFPGKETFVLNDGFAAALGEFWAGSGVQYDSILFYTLDSTVNGAIISHGKLTIGSRGFAGAFGHGLNIGHSNVPCVCGLKGCLSTICSEQGIFKFIMDEFKNNPSHPAAFYFNNVDLEKLDSGVIYDIYKKNNEPNEIYDLVKSALWPVLKHMAIMFMAIDPDAIIFSGSIARMDDLLIHLIKDALKELTFERFTENSIVEQAILGPTAAMIGAGYFALNDGMVD